MLRRFLRDLYRRIVPEPIPACDLPTINVLKSVLRPNSNTVDIGCNRGSILQDIVRLAPLGQHYAFEPIPRLAKQLKSRFPRVTVHQLALSLTTGTLQFNYFRDMDGFSGLVRRELDVDPGRVEVLTVSTAPLDQMMPSDITIDFIKIDVEGAELDVLRSGRELLSRCRPILLFECGKGGLDLYQHQPEELYDYLSEFHYRLQPLSQWQPAGQLLTREEFCNRFWNSPEYMYVATI